MGMAVCSPGDPRRTAMGLARKRNNSRNAPGQGKITRLGEYSWQTIANLYAVTISLVAIYVATSPAVPKVLGQAKDPKDWWKPVFYLSLVTFVALLTMTRVARNGIFWMFAGALNLAVAFLCFIMLIVCAKRTT